jgi:hypothetical protein
VRGEGFTDRGADRPAQVPAELAARFRAQRERLLSQLCAGPARSVVRQRLDALCRTYAQLQAARTGQDERRDRLEAADRLRRLIAQNLEDGLLRYSRRQKLLAEARRLGFSEFQAQLLIAQVQFGDRELEPARPSQRPTEVAPVCAVVARLAAAGVLALAIFLGLVRWLGA